MNVRDDVDQHIGAIVTIIDNLDYQVASKEVELEKVQNDITKAQEAHDSLVKQLAEEKKHLQSEKLILEDGVKPLRAEVLRLRDEINEGVATKSQLKVENARLHTKNTEFRAYEAQAMKILKAKETSLIERENSIRQQESLRPQNTGILPPRG